MRVIPPDDDASMDGNKCGDTDTALFRLLFQLVGYAIVVGGEVFTTPSGINKYWASTLANPIYSYTVSYVYGEWFVPGTSPGTTGYMADVSVWIGIDGYDSGTVEQIGTSSEYSPYTGGINYYAWWEVYPKFSHRISAMKVNPGDHIAAYVKFIPKGSSKKITDRGIFELSLRDLTTGRAFTIVQGPLQPGLYQGELQATSDSMNFRIYLLGKLDAPE